MTFDATETQPGGAAAPLADVEPEPGGEQPLEAAPVQRQAGLVDTPAVSLYGPLSGG